MQQPISQTDFPGLKLLKRGKVRDMYDLGEHFLMVATDRISAFDVIMDDPIPDKGIILTQISLFWFDVMKPIVANHVVSSRVEDYPAACRPYADQLRGRSMLVRKADPLPIECVARGYLSGSGLKDYQKTGAVCGHQLPAGLRDSDRLPQPIFTPATKEQSGHDINISEADAATLVGPGVFEKVKALTLTIYSEGVAYAEKLGIIIADTKFEFGILPGSGRPEDRIILIDEVLTPDSSRFWPQASYTPGGPQPSFDKQFVRDYLERIKWNKQPPVPSLPDDVVVKTREKYLDAFRRLTGRELA